MQRGYILLTTLILLALLAALTVAYFDRRALDRHVSAQAQDAATALLLAENALDLVYGRFLAGADLDGDGRPDRDQHGDRDRPPAPYIYPPYPGPGSERNGNDLLQAIAAGEALGDGPAAEGVTAWRVRDLYRDGAAPLHFLADSQGLPIPTTQPWEPVQDRPHAAVWMQLIPRPDGSHLLVIQVAAQAGTARRYLQRLAGLYDNTLGAPLGALTEANPAATGAAP